MNDIIPVELTTQIRGLANDLKTREKCEISIKDRVLRIVKITHELKLDPLSVRDEIDREFETEGVSDRYVRKLLPKEFKHTEKTKLSLTNDSGSGTVPHHSLNTSSEEKPKTIVLESKHQVTDIPPEPEQHEVCVKSQEEIQREIEEERSQIQFKRADQLQGWASEEQQQARIPAQESEDSEEEKTESQSYKEQLRQILLLKGQLHDANERIQKLRRMLDEARASIPATPPQLMPYWTENTVLIKKTDLQIRAPEFPDTIKLPIKFLVHTTKKQVEKVEVDRLRLEEMFA